MTLWTFFALILGAVHLAGIGAMIRCAQRAPEGYQDADGFHLGIDPELQPAAGGDPAEREWECAA